MLAVDQESVNLKVVGQGGNEVLFKMNRTTKLRKLMTVYCQRARQNLFFVTFKFDGDLVQAEQTPHELQMEDGDEIEAKLDQVRAIDMAMVGAAAA